MTTTGILAAAAAVVGSALLTYTFLSRKKPAKSKPRKIDPKIDVLKQGFTSGKATSETWDVIVIGSGIGGLSTASLLAQEGYKVLVLEQHDIAGGNMHSFKDKGFEYDTGIHYIGGKVGDERSPLNRMLKALSDDTCVKWAKMDDHFDIAAVPLPNGKLDKFEWNSHPKKMMTDLIAEFPDEKQAIQKYFKLIHKTQFWMTFYFSLALFPHWIASPVFYILRTFCLPEITKTTSQVINELTTNTRLQGVLGYIYGDGGLYPSKGSFLHHAVIFAHYFGGGYYPIGGSLEIARPIVRKIESLGGRVLVRAPVSEIIVDEKNGVATGVIVKGTPIQAKIIISAAGAINTYKKLIPQTQSHRIKRQLAALDKLTPTSSFVSLFVGLDTSDGVDLQLPRKNYWIFPTWDHKANNEAYEKDMDQPIPGCFISFPSAKDASYKERNPGKEVALVLCFAEYSWFAQYRDARVKHRGDEYESLKAIFKDRLLDQLLLVAPQLKDRIVFTDVGTPVTNDYYLGTLMGEVYGMAHSVDRFKEPLLMGPRTPIKGLYLSGQDSMINGWTGALLGGCFTAMVVDRGVMVKHMKNLA
ncbi:hypothetical protein HDV05_003430 [Chytridiales sp. JEL 0842]|nr:hypothetical protein HDV05_003430 [Chytridiales sp. JEL 0842]